MRITARTFGQFLLKGIHGAVLSCRHKSIGGSCVKLDR